MLAGPRPARCCAASARERRAARPVLVVAAATVGIPLVLAVLSSSKDYVLARNLLPALVPLLVVRRDRSHPAPRPPGRHPAGRRPGRLLARLLGLGESLAGPAATRLGLGRRRDRRAERAAGDGHLDDRPGLAALLPLDRLLPGPARRRLDWWVGEIDFISDGPAPPPPRRLFGPGFRRSATSGSAASTCAATPCRVPACAAAPAERARRRAWLPHQRGTSGRHRSRLTRLRNDASYPECPGETSEEKA